MSEEDRIDDYRKLAGSITNYTDNTCFYEDWLVIQQYVEDWLDELDKQKEILDKIKELINHYAVEDEDYSKIYNQEEKDILELLEEIE